MTRRTKVALPLLASVLLLAGCISDSAPASLEPSPLPDSPASENTDLAQGFRLIADTSCQMSYDIGVTEIVLGTTNRSVMVPEAYIYNDFFAAVISDEGGLEPIWSPDNFVSCFDYVNFVSAEEVGAEYEILLSGDLDSGLITSEYKLEESGSIIMNYVVKDGVFVRVTVTSPSSTTEYIIKYGLPSETDIAYFQEAIDSWLASG